MDWIGVGIVWSRIILSLILSISNSNDTQKHKYLLEKSYLFEGGKKNGRNSKSITIFLVYVPWLKKNLPCFFFFFFFFFCSHIHSLCILRMRQHFTLSLPWLSLQRRQPFALFSLAISPLRRRPFTLSSFAIFLKAATLYSLLLGYSQLKIPFFSLDFTL